MLGAIAPDIDLLYYFLIDPSQPRHYHHTYITHFPIFWLTLLLISVLWLGWLHNRSKNQTRSLIFSLNGFIHTVLDTLTGHISWLAPFMDKPFSLTADASAATMYFTRWTFGLELLLILWAFSLWYKSSGKETNEIKKPIE
jgi:inner membrane protein